jgi:hypothetical protein
MAAMRHAQVRLVEAMLRYLRADALGDGQEGPLHVPTDDGTVVPPTPPPIGTPPPTDENDDPEAETEVDP